MLAFEELESSCLSLIDALKDAKRNGVQLVEATLVAKVQHLRDVISALDVIEDFPSSEKDEEKDEDARDNAGEKRKKRSRTSPSSAALPKRSNPKRLATTSTSGVDEERDNSSVGEREKGVREKNREKRDSVVGDGKDVVVEKEIVVRKKGDIVIVGEKREKVGELDKGKAKRIKTGGLVLGPQGELGFFTGQQGATKGHVVCSIFAGETNVELLRSSLDTVSFEAIEGEKQFWVCKQVFELCCKSLQRQLEVKDVIACVSKVCNCLNKVKFLKEDSTLDAINTGLESNVIFMQKGLEFSEMCRNSVYFMMAARLHSELKESVSYGALTQTFRAKLAELRTLYNIDSQASTLERNVPAGRLMLRCWPLAFVNITLIVEQQKVVEKVLEIDQFYQKLMSFGEIFLQGQTVPLKENPEVSTVANDLMHLAALAGAEAKRDFWVTKTLQARDFASLLCPVIRDNKFNPMCALFEVDFMDMMSLPIDEWEPRDQGDWTWLREYVKLLQESGISVQFVDSWSVVKSALDSYDFVLGVSEDAKNLFWANNRAHQVLVLLVEFGEKSGTTVDLIIGKCTWQLTYRTCESFASHHDHGFCILSQFLCNLRGLENKQVLKLQIAYELLKGKTLPQSLSFLDLIRQHQTNRKFIDVTPLDASLVTSGNAIEEQLMTIGFVVVNNFISIGSEQLGMVEELKQLVRQSERSELVLRSARLSWLKTVSSTALNALLSEAEHRLEQVFNRRVCRDTVAFLSTPGCEPRPHTDYSPADLEGLIDDGLCRGLPIGAFIAIQSQTLFDIWPGAISWEHREFFEHVQLSLDAGSVCFFLGTAVHAAAVQIEENVRLHAFIEGRQMASKRDRESQYFMDSEAGVVTILPRGVSVGSE